MHKHCLIIGASGDIGKAIAVQLANEGFTLSLHYYKNEQIINDLFKALPDEVIMESVQGDLRTEKGISQFIQSVSFQPTHVVFANGQSLNCLLQETTNESMDELFYVHVKALWRITKAFLPSMIRNQYGNFIVISSIWGEIGASSEVIYSSVKGAQNSFVKALAKEVAINNIRINGISPGLIRTKMNAHLTKQEECMLTNEIPANRMGTTKEVADLAAFLVKDSASYINGEIIKIDGAW
ncbi:3-oxoacyl-[acyl-carrier-protein] reductase FabG [Paraliobacillus sp. PM-2]|uniref:elongation factor P 5-aminopentanone reductase n=1 Tax=Paraliobacillus sp. PM-2 TaxID=1462524 RepID=UPI00061C19EF|nr:SDR family oxidoreductase [Paraliobacillus sp. PM-2]CQR47631.1 3-oxoacyl-[acyl-carrier-protein] reductase FabG [Paraliobacillus sp. PM-2]